MCVGAQLAGLAKQLSKQHSRSEAAPAVERGGTGASSAAACMPQRPRCTRLTAFPAILLGPASHAASISYVRGLAGSFSRIRSRHTRFLIRGSAANSSSSLPHGSGAAMLRLRSRPTMLATSGGTDDGHSSGDRSSNLSPDSSCESLPPSPPLLSTGTARRTLKSVAHHGGATLRPGSGR